MVRLVILLLRLVLARKLGKILELRGRKSRGRAGLERAAEKQLRRKQRSEVHVETGSRSLQISAILVARGKSAGVDGHVVGPLRVPVTVAGLVGSKGTMGKAVMASIDLPGETSLKTGTAGRGRGTVVLLHIEKVRGQAEAVPRVLR